MKEASVEPRKLDHIKICLEKPVQAQDKTAGLEDIELIHNAIPEISKKDVDLSLDFLDHNLDAPIIIAAMTGGHLIAKKINATLAEAARKLNIGLGVGSQRAALEDPGLVDTFRVVREIAPDAFIIGNLGAPQLSRGYSLREIEKATKMIDANAIAIHLNALQEAIQPEGETDFSGVIDAIGDISKKSSVPIIAKETGAGIAREEAQILEKSGIAAIDVGGAGGTSWAGVETYRAVESEDESRNRIGKTFWDWGIPTAVSAFEVAQSTKLPVIATGGVRSGLDAAKLIALGASVVGVAFPLLQSAYRGDVNHVINTLNTMIEELRIAMHLVGAKTVGELKGARVIISGKTGQWLRLRGYELSNFANRTPR
ncbi:MAG: type 2 isopentenyl-diphosphate Delta-isomerase [Candidatus Hodarchaeota archaeon]